MYVWMYIYIYLKIPFALNKTRGKVKKLNSMIYTRAVLWLKGLIGHRSKKLAMT